MNYRLLQIILIGCLMMIFSCKTKEAMTSSNAQGSKDSSEVKAKHLSPEREKIADKKMWLGSEIVAEAVDRLDSKLSVNKSTEEKLKTILTNTFTRIGGKLTSSYPDQEARSMGKKIIIDSKVLIIDVLENDSQRTEFKNLTVH